MPPEREAAAETLGVVCVQPGAFDIVVTVFNMPALPGLDLARDLAAIRADLPVILASGHIDEATQTAALNSDLHARVNKERLAEDLAPRVQAAIAGRPD